MSREEEAMRYPAYPAITPRITQRLPSREGPRAGVETRERSDEQNMWRFLEARWRDWRLILHLKFSAAHYPPIAQRLPQGTVGAPRHEFLPMVCRAQPSPQHNRPLATLSDCVCAQQDAVLQEIAASGESKYEWAALKPLLAEGGSGRAGSTTRLARTSTNRRTATLSTRC